MADVASLVVRVKADGVDQAAKGLDGLSKSANSADKAASSFSKQADTAGKASSSFGTKAQQAGFQVQDMVVQLQGGTSAFVAISQQVPQFLGAFGPIGAVTGTVVALAAAIGGVLYKSMGDATLSAEELKEANKNLAAVLRETDSGTVVLTDSILKLAEANEQAARATLAVAMADAQTQIKGAQQAAEEAATSIDSFFSSINAAGSLENATRELENYRAAGHSTEQALIALGDTTTSTYANLGATANFTARLSEELGITTSEALGLTDALSGVTKLKTPEALQAAANRATELASASGYTNEAMNALAGSLQKAYLDMLRGVEASEALKGALDSLGGAATKAGAEVRAAAGLQLEALRVQTLAGREQILAQADLAKQQIDQKKDFNELEKEIAKAHIDTLAKQQITALGEQESKRAASDAKSLASQQASDAKRIESSHKRFDAENAQADAYIAKLQQSNMTELELIGSQEQAKVDTVAGYRERGLITEQEYQDAITEIRRNAITTREDLEIDAMKKLNDENQKIIDGEMRTKQEVAEKDQKRIDDGIDAQRNMTGDLKAALGEQSKAYKASAIISATIDTYKAATGAFSALAPIPIVGPALGAAAAAAAITAGLANVAAIKGAREQGGYMSAGSAYQMAERGKAEVIVPSGNSRAKTVGQMREMMGGSNGGPSSIVIVNQTTGRIDSVEQEQTDEGQLRLIIREEMVSQTMEQGSGFAKARRQTRSQPGY
jgi:hypothetical protein